MVSNETILRWLFACLVAVGFKVTKDARQLHRSSAGHGGIILNGGTKADPILLRTPRGTHVCKNSDFAHVHQASVWTMLTDGAEYIDGGVKLGLSVKRHSTVPVDLVVMELETKPLSSDAWSRLGGVGWKRCVVGRIAPKDEAGTFGRFRDQFTKLHVWGMTVYSTLLYLDSDTLAVSSIDALLRTKLGSHMIGAARDYGEGKWRPTFNMGVFLVHPSTAEYRRLCDLQRSGSIKFQTAMSEQGFLNVVYKDMWHDIGFANNANLAIYTQGREFWDDHISQVNIIHYTMEKPWKCSEAYAEPCSRWRQAAAVAPRAPPWRTDLARVPELDDRAFVKVCPRGRIGNVLFLFASGLGIAERRGATLCMPVASECNSDYLADVVSALQSAFVGPLAPTCPSGSYESVGEAGYAKFQHFQSTSRRVNLNDVYLQSWRYFDDVKDNVRARLQFRDTVKQNASRIVDARRDKGVAVVGIHVRHGDLNDHGYQLYPDDKYFQDAMTYFRVKHNGSVSFVVLSDKPTWCQRQSVFMQSDVNVLNEGRSAVVDLAVLASCDGVITSLGTFGWWAGWLSNKEVIYHTKMFNMQHEINAGRVVPGDFFPTSWIGLPYPKDMPTIVTAYFRLKSKHSDSDYAAWTSNLLSMTDPMVIFTSPDLVGTMSKLREHAAARTHIVAVNLNDTWIAREWPKSYWELQLNIDPEKDIHQSYELFWIWLSKSWFVTEAIKRSPFQSDSYVWCDIGSMRTGEYRSKRWVRHPEVILPSAMLMMSSKPRPLQQADTPWIVKAEHYPLDQMYVAGAHMAGFVSTWLRFHSAFKDTIKGYKARGLFVGDDQPVLQSTCVRHPGLCGFVTSDMVSGDVWFGLVPTLYTGLNGKLSWPHQDRTVWQVWLGGAMPPVVKAALDSCTKVHEGSPLSMQLVTEDTLSHYLPELHPSFHLLDRVEQSDYIRLELLHNHGGFYLDADVFCLRSLERLYFRAGELKLDVSGARNRNDHPPIQQRGVSTVFNQNTLGPVRSNTAITAAWHKGLMEVMEGLTPSLLDCQARSSNGSIAYPIPRIAGPSICGVKWGAVIDFINPALWKLEQAGGKIGFQMSLCDENAKPMGLDQSAACDTVHLGLAGVDKQSRRAQTKQQVCQLPALQLPTARQICGLKPQLVFISKPKCASNYIDDLLMGGQRRDVHRAGHWMYRKFTDAEFLMVVRNPYDLIISWYIYHKHSPRESEAVRGFYPSSIDAWIIERKCACHWGQPFSRFTPPEWHTRNPLRQVDWLPPDTAKLSVVRFEYLTDDLAKVANAYNINMSHQSTLRNEAPATKPKLTIAAQRRVRVLFHDDFHRFGYSSEIECVHVAASDTVTVTALWDIGREMKTHGDGRKLEQYVGWLRQTLTLNAAMVVFAEPHTIAEVRSERNATGYPTCYVSMAFNEHPYYSQFYDKNEKVTSSAAYLARIQHPQRVEVKNPQYNILQWGKIELMRMAIEDYNPFDSRSVIWVDAGLSRFVDLPVSSRPFPDPSVVQEMLASTRKLYISTIPETGTAESARKKHCATDEAVWSSVNLLAGTVLMSSASSIASFEREWRAYIHTRLNQGESNNDQILAASLWCERPGLFSIIDTAGKGHWLGFHKALHDKSHRHRRVDFPLRISKVFL